MLTSEEREALVKYRLEKAVETLVEARDCAKMDHWTLAANRLYYSAYYASSALLIQKGIVAKSHEGVIGMIGQHFRLSVPSSRMVVARRTCCRTAPKTLLGSTRRQQVCFAFIPIHLMACSTLKVRESCTSSMSLVRKSWPRKSTERKPSNCPRACISCN